MIAHSNFPRCFQQYRPRSHKVFGVICGAPSKKFLLVKGRKARKWSFPKGHMEGTETALDCALRELWEETGIRLDGRTYSGTVKLSKNTDGKNSEYFVYNVESEIPARIHDSDEIIDAGWFTVEEMRTMYCNMDVTSFHMRGGYLT